MDSEPHTLTASECEKSKSAARYFYCAKATRSDRNEGLDDPGVQFARHTTLRQVEVAKKLGQLKGNTHPTVKPVELMQYLVRLVTPTGGTVLDLFMGSGSTGKAAMLEGFDFIGIELSSDYVEISRARIEEARTRMTNANINDLHQIDASDAFTGSLASDRNGAGEMVPHTRSLATSTRSLPCPIKVL